MLGQKCDTWSYLLSWQPLDASVTTYMYLDVFPKLYYELLGSRLQVNVVVFFAPIPVPS